MSCRAIAEHATPVVRPALKVGAVNDPTEVEADAVADMVMSIRPSRPVAGAVESSTTPTSVPTIRRACGCGCGGGGEIDDLRRTPHGEVIRCQEDVEEEDELQLKPDGEVLRRNGQTEEDEEIQPKARSDRGSHAVTAASVARRIAATRGAGSPMPSHVRGFFEPRFGADLSEVRLHTTDDAATMAESLRARAFTVGQDVYLGRGEAQFGSADGRRLLAHELVHTFQNRGRDHVRRQVAPNFRDCTTANTGQADPNTDLENARVRARQFVGTAIRNLGAAPAAGTTYATAAQRHFINPSAGQRATIQTTYRAILRNLRRSNFICNSGAICGTEQAFWIPQDDLLHVCPPFWGENRTCQAIVLIHEAAHDSGVDAAPGAHAPNRGSGAYPAGNTLPPVGQTTAGRMGNCDAYAFFAAHLWRSTDAGSSCF